MKASTEILYFLKRPLLSIIGLWLIWNANRFDDTKFIVIAGGLFAVFVTDILTEHGQIKEVVEKGLETAGRLRHGGDSGDS